MRNRESSFEKRVTLTIIVLFINLILISNSVILDNNRSVLGSLLYSIVTPVHMAWNGFTGFVTDKFNHYIFVKNNQKKIIELRKKIRELLYKNYKLKETLNNLNIKEFPSLKNRSYILANVVSVNSGFPLSGAVVNRGILSGVHKGMIVLNENMELVGKVANPITLFSAKVKFITDPAGGVGAYIDSNRLEGLLKGTNTEICHFEYIMGNRKVEKGSLVITSGTDKIYPPFIKIGKVVKTEKKVLIQKIFVKPFFLNRSIKTLILVEQ